MAELENWKHLMIQSEERGVKNSPVVDKDDISFSWLPIGRWANKKLINIPTARPLWNNIYQIFLQE